MQRVLPLLLIPTLLSLGSDSGSVSRVTMEGSMRRAEIYKFPLRATSRARSATGIGELKPAASPFGFAVTAEGFPVYDLVLSIRGLRTPKSLGSAGSYVVWLVTPDLDRTEKLGPVDPAGTFRFRVSTMNKFILVVSLETSSDVTKRSGPIMLRGISPSGLMQSFASHELFDNMPHNDWE